MRDDHRPGGPSHIHIERKKGFNWLPLLLLALVLLGLLFALSRCGQDDEAAAPVPVPTATATATATAVEPAPAATVVATTPNAATSAAAAGTAALGSYLAGVEPTPRTFTFDKLNFDTARSAVRGEDAAAIGQVAATLKQYPNARIRIAGYADARGAAPANIALGKARADAIKNALVAQGIEANRVETVSGGENDPVASNATPGGRFENRRTELVVTAR